MILGFLSCTSDRQLHSIHARLEKKDICAQWYFLTNRFGADGSIWTRNNLWVIHDFNPPLVFVRVKLDFWVFFPWKLVEILSNSVGLNHQYKSKGQSPHHSREHTLCPGPSWVVGVYQMIKMKLDHKRNCDLNYANDYWFNQHRLSVIWIMLSMLKKRWASMIIYLSQRPLSSKTIVFFREFGNVHAVQGALAEI